MSQTPSKRQLKPKSATHFLYLASAKCEDGAWVKVGISGELVQRTQYIACGCPIPIRSVWYRELSVAIDESEWAEKVMHAVLSEHHTSGEWFKLEATQDLRNMVDKVLAQFIAPSPWAEYILVESKWRNPNAKAENLYRQADRKAKAIRAWRAKAPLYNPRYIEPISASELATIYRSK